MLNFNTVADADQNQFNSTCNYMLNLIDKMNHASYIHVVYYSALLEQVSCSSSYAESCLSFGHFEIACPYSSQCHICAETGS